MTNPNAPTEWVKRLLFPAIHDGETGPPQITDAEAEERAMDEAELKAPPTAPAEPTDLGKLLDDWQNAPEKRRRAARTAITGYVSKIEERVRKQEEALIEGGINANKLLDALVECGVIAGSYGLTDSITVEVPRSVARLREATLTEEEARELMKECEYYALSPHLLNALRRLSGVENK